MSEKVKGMFGHPERAEEVRKWLLSQGAKENGYNCDMDSCIYFIRTDGVVNYVHEDYAELFDIVKLPKPEHKFKPFDKVLVRDNAVNDVWTPSLYGFYRENSTYPHLVIGGSTWIHCIPYEGNEHLVGTSKNPEEE